MRWEGVSEGAGGGLWTLKPPMDVLGGARVNNVENSFISSDEMEIRSFGEKPLIFGVKRGDGRIFEAPLPGDSALEFKSALKAADGEIGPIINLMTDGHASYPQATEWLGIIHHLVNRSENGFVDERGFHANGVENLWSHERG